MPSSTSNSNDRIPAIDHRRHWLAVAACAALMVAAGETCFRWLGYGPAFLEDKDAWAQRRLRVDELPSQDHIVIVGSSRAVADLRPAVFKQVCPDAQVTMLAINGAQMAAGLQDVAENTDFAGLLLCSIGVENFAPKTAQRPWVEHYQTHYTHGGRYDRLLNRSLRTWLQTHFVLANPPTLALQQSLRSGVLVPRGRVHEPDGSAAICLADQPDPFRAQAVKKSLAPFRRPPPALADPDKWDRMMQTYARWVEMIHSRGGRVVFLVPPISEPRRSFVEAYLPRDRYADRIPERTGAALIHYANIPEALTMDCPDTSHLRHGDAERFTQLVVEQLRQKGLLSGRTATAGPNIAGK